MIGEPERVATWRFLGEEEVLRAGWIRLILCTVNES